MINFNDLSFAEQNLLDEEFGGCCNEGCDCNCSCDEDADMNYISEIEVRMAIEAIGTHIKFLKGMVFSINDPEFTNEVEPEIASFEILRDRLSSLVEVEEEELDIDEEEDLSQYRNSDNVKFIRTAEMALGLHKANLEILDDKDFVEYLSYLDLAINNAITDQQQEW